MAQEFLGRFHDYLEKSHIPHDFTYPHSPKINGVVERFNHTLQEEFLSVGRLIREDILSLDENFQKWLDWYNQARPHYALKYQTPIDFINKFYFQKQ